MNLVYKNIPTTSNRNRDIVLLFLFYFNNGKIIFVINNNTICT